MSKIMIITGGSTGIGAATVKKSLEAGYSVVATARTISKLDELKNTINHPKLEVFACDIVNYDELISLKTFVLEKFGRIDIVFANAGFTSGSTSYLEGNTPNEWKDMVMTNVYGAAITANVFLSELVKTQGQLILTGSVIGRYNVPLRLYSATKWAVTGMAESIRKEMIGTNVRVTLLEPGAVDTPFWDEGTTFKASLTPDEVADVVVFATRQPKNVDLNEILLRPTGQNV